MTNRHFIIHIESDDPVAEQQVRAGVEHLVDRIGFDGNSTTTVEFLKDCDFDAIDTIKTSYVAGWYLEPGEDTDE